MSNRITLPHSLDKIPSIGAAGKSWGPIFDFVPPINADFSWVNQGSATVTDVGGSIVLAAPGEASFNLRMRKKAAPSTPYSIELGFLASGLSVSGAYGQVGGVWRESGSGKLSTVVYSFSTAIKSPVFVVDNFTNETTYVSTPQFLELATSATVLFLKMEDDGVNRTSYVSADGQTWIGLLQVGRTSHLTANEVGFVIRVPNSSFGMAMHLLHWKENT